MKNPPANYAARRVFPLIPWLILALGFSATAWFTASAYHQMLSRDRERFGYEVRELVDRLDTRLETYCQALMGLRDWYSANHDKLTDEAWDNFIYTFHAPQHYPGLYNVGYAEKVIDWGSDPSLPALQEHLQRSRKRFGPAYDLSLPPEAHPGFCWYHMPVIWHSFCQWRREKVREYKHYGLDLNQNVDLWSAMNWALGDDRPGISGKQKLDPDQMDKEGLFLFLPVYSVALHAEPVNLNPVPWHMQHLPAKQLREARMVIGRLAHLRGLVFAGIDMNTFLQHHLSTNAQAVTFALYGSRDQSSSHSEDQLLFDNRERPASRKFRLDHGMEATPQIALYGRMLQFVAEPGPGFSSAVNERTLASAAGFGFTTTLLLAGFIGYQSRANKRQREISAALRLSEARLQRLLHERERMSRDLHDGTIQSLYAIGLGLGRLRKSIGTAPERDRLEASLVELDCVIAELRGHLVSLDPGVSPVQTAGAALSELLKRLSQTSETELNLFVEPGAGENCPPAAVLDLLHAVREGVSNAWRHGQATQINMALRNTEHGGLTLSIKDNGRGFNAGDFSPRAGHGLANLERRAQAWNGSLRVDSRPEGPTELVISFNTTTNENE